MDSDAEARVRDTPRASDLAEGLAISASILCLAHCLFLPLVLAWSPALSRTFDLPFDLHLWIVLIAGPVSLTILVRAAKRARMGILVTGVAGLSLLVLALVLPVTDMQEIAISSIGSMLLAMAHLANWAARHPKAHLHA
ncbi:MerC domain-containing protein [Sphingomonas sp. 35-24ZXX]|uniref:MerC domain-containing protein n=1 Tax=Sphingomonas sp. 35-24ZXX TaxID=1545915 RepID=UPI000689C886|nr:MerC domain-containing protein [Sphingomonas sp. 35-24ZXX]